MHTQYIPQKCQSHKLFYFVSHFRFHSNSQNITVWFCFLHSLPVNRCFYHTSFSRFVKTLSFFAHSKSVTLHSILFISARRNCGYCRRARIANRVHNLLELDLFQYCPKGLNCVLVSQKSRETNVGVHNHYSGIKIQQNLDFCSKS